MQQQVVPANVGMDPEAEAERRADSLEREKRELLAQRKLLMRRLSAAERKDAAVTLRMPRGLHEEVGAAAAREGFKNAQSFIFALLARMQGDDLETSYEAFANPSFGAEIKDLAALLHCKPSEVFEILNADAGVKRAVSSLAARLQDERERMERQGMEGGSPDGQPVMVNLNGPGYL